MDIQASYNEKALLLQVAAGDETAFGTLFHAWRDKLYFFLLRITSSPETAEDVLQDVFVKLWVNRQSLVSIDHFSAYLYRMTQNHAINGMRRMSLETLVLCDLRREAITDGQPADEALLFKQMQEKLKEVINSLPPQQRLVYTLSREKGLKQDEIARQLNISISTVKNHMTQALRTIREHLGSQYPGMAMCGLILMAGLSTI